MLVLKLNLFLNSSLSVTFLRFLDFTEILNFIIHIEKSVHAL